MAKLCPHCGKPLPRGDARFCNTCGAHLISQGIEGAAFESFDSYEDDSYEDDEPAFEDLPTSHLHSVEDLPTSHLRSVSRNGVRQNDIDQVDTRVMQAQQPAPPAPRPFPAQVELLRQQYQHSATRGPLTPSLPVSQPGGMQPVAPYVAPPVSKKNARPVTRNSKTRLIMLTILLVVLLIGGVATWLIAFQIFGGQDITATTISYQNANLGFALEYPQGWTAQANTQATTITFSDATHTDQFMLSSTAQNGLTIAGYIKKITTQLGMTGEKNQPPLTFAGATWQQVQGSVLLSGATYDTVILVSTHAGRLYALQQMAPASTYAGAERLFFAPVRATFRFV